MDPIAEIREGFQQYPDAHYEAGENFIRYLPPSEEGFSVALHLDGDGYTVYFEGWHETFAQPKDAVGCFAFGLSTACRLKVISRNGYAHKWTVEWLEDGTWQADSETGLLFFPFWRRPSVHYLQNTLITDEED